MSFHLANNLALEGNRIVFISKRPYYKSEKTQHLGKGELILTSWPSEKFSTGWKDFKWFSQLFRKFNPSVVIGHHNGSITSLITSKLLAGKNVKTLDYYHVCTPSFISDARGLTPRLRFFFFRKRLFFHLFCDHVICPSRFALEDVKNYFGYAKGVEIVNPIPDRFPKDDPEITQKRTIAYLGRLDPTKNVIKLIQAFVLHKQAFPSSNLKLRIAGTGILRQEVEELTSNTQDIEFLGKIKYHEVDRYLVDSTFVMIPSVFDNLPTVSLEAMMLSKPVLLSSGVGTKDYLEEGKDCLLFNPDRDDIKALLDKLMSLDENQIKEMGQNARKTYLKHFQMEKYIGALKEVCRL